jgi:hypothetical protein
MGYDKNRFRNPGEIPEEVICAVCLDVLKEPLQRDGCEHIFCKDCIHEWLSNHKECPECRQDLALDKLKDVPRVLKSLLNRLVINCDHHSDGCKEWQDLGQLKAHIKECPFTPDLVLHCPCGQSFQREESGFPVHGCPEYKLQVAQVIQTQAQAAVEKIKALHTNFDLVNTENNLMAYLFDDDNAVYKTPEDVRVGYDKYKSLVGDKARALTGVIEAAVQTLGEDSKTRLPKLLEILKRDLTM